MVSQSAQTTDNTSNIASTTHQITSSPLALNQQQAATTTTTSTTTNKQTQLVLASDSKPFDFATSYREEVVPLRSTFKRIGLLGHRIQPYQVNLLSKEVSEDHRPISQSTATANSSRLVSNSGNFTNMFMRKFGIANTDQASDFATDINNSANFESIIEEATLAAAAAVDGSQAKSLQHAIKSPSLQKLSERLKMMTKQQTSLEPIRTNTATNPSATSISKFYSTMNASTNIIYQLSKLRRPVRSESTKSNQHHRSQIRMQAAGGVFHSSSMNSIDEQERTDSADIDEMKMDTLADFSENYSFI
jgi:hypothetical protein